MNKKFKIKMVSLGKKSLRIFSVLLPLVIIILAFDANVLYGWSFIVAIILFFAWRFWVARAAYNWGREKFETIIFGKPLKYHSQEELKLKNLFRWKRKIL